MTGRMALLAALTFSALPAVPTAAQQAPLRGLDEYIERARREWQVPGVAVAIVKDDSVVYAKGFGVREAGKPEPVDANTVFAIGSAGKAFTAAAMGMLVDEGQVGWDDPVTRHLPAFELFDPYVTREITVRDLLTHNSGLERGEFMWYASDYDREEVLRRVRHLEPSWSFRSRFGYQNIMYLAAGQVVAAATGGRWDDFIRERLFAPLGMTRSSTTVDALPTLSNVASPHVRSDGEPLPISYRDIDNMAPAGAINASARDVAQWVRLHLNEGSYEGRRLLKEETVRELHSPQTLIDIDGGGAGVIGGLEPDFLAYGMGWFLHDYQGKKAVQHGGNIDGMTALVAMIPDEELGVVVLTGMNASRLPHAVAYRIFDAYLGAPRKDWSATMKARRDSLRAQNAESADEPVRIAGTAPTLELARYAGRYMDPMYGEVDVALDDGRLVLRRGSNWVGDLEHWHYDTFQANWRDPGLAAVVGEMLVTFHLDARGEVSEVEIQGMGVFGRAPEQAAHAERSDSAGAPVTGGAHPDTLRDTTLPAKRLSAGSLARCGRWGLFMAGRQPRSGILQRTDRTIL